MGGKGSGRWHSDPPKRRVGDFCKVSMQKLPNYWAWDQDGRVKFKYRKWDVWIQVESYLDRGGELNLLIDAYLGFFGEEVNPDMTCSVRVSYSSPYMGGNRMWFECPSCGRQIGVLYLAPWDKEIGCRICMDLKY